MKQNSAFQSILVSTLCVTLLTGAFFAVPGANAELAAPSAGSTSAPTAVEEQYCNSVCPSIANSDGQLLNLSGQVGWTSADDQWCANHNSQTNPSIMASPAPLGASVPSGSCSVSYYPGDTSCAQVSAGFTRCQYKNSQVESYCQAYEAAKMAGAGEDLLLTLDIAATATCGAVCAAEMTSIGAGIGVQKVCDGAAMGAGAAEFLVVLAQAKQAADSGAPISGMQKTTLAVNGVLGAAGIAEGALGWKTLNKANGACYSNQTTSIEPSTWAKFAILDRCQSEFMSMLIPNAEAVPPAVDDDTIANKKPGSAAPLKQGQGCAKAACITAATLAVLTGVRYYNNGYGKRSKESSCNNIWGLQSSATAIAGGITAAGYTASGGSVGSTSGSSIGSTGTASGTSAATGLNCMKNGGTVASCAGQSSAATDGGILGNSGLGNAALPLAQQLANSGLPAALGSGGGLGAAMGGAMSGAGDMGAALTKVAQVAADNAKELGQVASMGGYSGGGGGGGATASDSNGLANLFGNAGGPAAATAPMQVFRGDGEDSDDIWHSHSSSNIFQIVSHRIGKTNP